MLPTFKTNIFIQIGSKLDNRKEVIGNQMLEEIWASTFVNLARVT